MGQLLLETDRPVNGDVRHEKQTNCLPECFWVTEITGVLIT